MKIDEITQSVNNITKLEASLNKKTEQEAKTIQEKDQFNRPGEKIDLSNASVEYSQAAERVDKAPETREEKVAELKELVKKGKYNVASVKVADKILEDNLADIPNLK